jgi:hypothetical protein
MSSIQREHPIFDKKCKFHPKHTLVKPTFSPTLPLAIAREKLVRGKRANEKAIEERTKDQGEAGESIVDA